ncbi:MAG: acyl-CoA transferase [Rhizobiales bacterium PAR1]|nr:MAG: acyl-CoA transferase [Rhizobiales bacterium PAR1]
MDQRFFSDIGMALDTAGVLRQRSRFSSAGQGDLASWFAVTDLAVASIGAAGAELQALADETNETAITVDRRLASLWFGMSIQPQGWELPSIWDPVAGDYPTRDGWIRLHTNAPHHRAAALSVLGVGVDREAVARAVATWDGLALEHAVVEAGGCAAFMMTLEHWQQHPQGRAVASEPLIHWHEAGTIAPKALSGHAAAPLSGLRVLDLTRVLAGPVAGRFLAAYGADVLRIDPPSWDEPAVVPEVTLGKRCAGLDLTLPEDRARFEGLAAEADILLHGYRPGALAGLGLDADTLRKRNPTLIEVTLCAYGWTGPWAGRRGFDSLVQMSSGIAAEGMRRAGANRPVPLPVQALDHAAGYLLAASALRALRHRASSGRVLTAKVSLARTAAFLIPSLRGEAGPGMAKAGESDLAAGIETTDWGAARRVRFPLRLDAIAPSWPYPATKLRSKPAVWR